MPWCRESSAGRVADNARWLVHTGPRKRTNARMCAEPNRHDTVSLQPPLSDRSAAARHARQLWVTVRRHNEHSFFLFIFAIFVNAKSYDYNGGSVWNAESFRRALAEHAAIARGRNRVEDGRQRRNHPLIVEGIHALRRKLMRGVAVP